MRGERENNARIVTALGYPNNRILLTALVVGLTGGG